MCWTSLLCIVKELAGGGSFCRLFLVSFDTGNTIHTRSEIQCLLSEFFKGAIMQFCHGTNIWDFAQNSTFEHRNAKCNTFLHRLDILQWFFLCFAPFCVRKVDPKLRQKRACWCHICLAKGAPINVSLAPEISPFWKPDSRETQTYIFVLKTGIMSEPMQELEIGPHRELYHLAIFNYENCNKKPEHTSVRIE